MAFFPGLGATAVLFQPTQFGIIPVDSETASSLANLTIYTFSVSLTGVYDGPIITVGTRGSSTRTVSALTVDGVAWTKASEIASSARTASVGAVKKSGGTGTVSVVVTMSGGATALNISVLSVRGLQSQDFVSGTAQQASGNPETFSVDIPAGGIMVATTVNAQSGITGSCDWGSTGTKYQDELSSEGTTDYLVSSAYKTAKTALGAYRMTGTWSVDGNAVGAAAAFH